MFKKIALLLFCLFVVGWNSNLTLVEAARKNLRDEQLGCYHFTVHQKDESFSAFFRIDSTDCSKGIVKRSYFRARNVSLGMVYALSNVYGLEASGYVRKFSLGMLYPAAKVIDIYNKEKKWMGKISGEGISAVKVCFSIYNEENRLVGVAHLNKGRTGFTIFNGEGECRIIAQLNRNQIVGVTDHWDVTVYEKEEIDLTIIKIFAAFCCDYQNKF